MGEQTDRSFDQAFGIDIGGSGIKGALVDTTTGALLTSRVRYPTPSPSTPDLVAEIVARIVSEAGWDGVIGATFPAVIKHGVALSAANVDPSWIGTDVDAVFTKATTGDVIVLNDADAAGIAEARFGAAKGVSGVVIMLTFGTGIGSALLVDGKLVPNTELGHLELDGYDAETRAAASVPGPCVPGRSFAEQVARMPRLIGTSVGVKLTLTGAPAAWDRFWIISGVCRCTPPTP